MTIAATKVTAPKMPPAEFAAAAPAELRAKLEEHAAAVARWREAGVELDAAKADVPTAQREDRRRAAEALRNGEADPGEKETKKAEKLVTEAERKYEIAREVVALEEHDLLRSFGEHIDAWKEGLAECRQQHSLAFDADVAQAKAHAQAAHDAESAIAWLDRIVTSGRFQSFTPGRPRIRLRGIESNLMDLLDDIARHGLFPTPETDAQKFDRAARNMRGLA